ncbi:MAG: hypothetical protein LUG60_06000 [Erysipelotrichaceae bacterium]|nr:hypothetical protein [Erysipelotrichaceae bacterium]
MKFYKNKDDLYNDIDSLFADIEFSYKGIDGSICPFSRDDISLSWGDNEKSFNSVSSLMKNPFFNGESLNDIYNKIEILGN